MSDADGPRQGAARTPGARRLRVAALAALTAAVVALPSIRNGFVEDDHWVVEQRPILHHPPSLAALVVEPWWPATFQGALWRPSVLLSFALDYRIGADPRWFHAVNVLWAALATGLLTLLAASLGGTGVGLATGLLFAVHPVHVEAVANLVGRAELIAAAAYAAALLCALRAAQDRRWLLGVGLAAAVAIGAKEHAATLPAAVALVLLVRRQPLRRMLAPALAAAVPVAAYFAARGAVVHGTLSVGGLAPGLEGLDLPRRAWAMLALSLQWWRLLVFPVRLSADYSPAQVTVSTGLTPAHLAAAALWLGAAWAAWRSRRRALLVTLGIAWLALTLLPVANLVPTEILVAERTLYLPSWGFLLAAVGAVAPLAWPRRAVLAVVGTLVVLGAARSAVRAGVWRDDDSWFAALQRDAPHSYRTLWLEGDDAFRSGRWGTGERLLQEASQAAPGIPGPLEDLAGRYAQAGAWPLAERALRRSIATTPGRARPWRLLVDVLQGSGDTAAASATALQAVTRFPTDTATLRAAAIVLVSNGRCVDARTLLRESRAPLPPSAAAALGARVALCGGPVR